MRQNAGNCTEREGMREGERDTILDEGRGIVGCLARQALPGPVLVRFCALWFYVPLHPRTKRAQTPVTKLALANFDRSLRLGGRSLFSHLNRREGAERGFNASKSCCARGRAAAFTQPLRLSLYLAHIAFLMRARSISTALMYSSTSSSPSFSKISVTEDTRCPAPVSLCRALLPASSATNTTTSSSPSRGICAVECAVPCSQLRRQ